MVINVQGDIFKYLVLSYQHSKIYNDIKQRKTANHHIGEAFDWLNNQND